MDAPPEGDGEAPGQGRGDANNDDNVDESASEGFLPRLCGFHAWGHLSAAAGAQDFFSISPSRALPSNSENLMLPLQNTRTAAQRPLDQPREISLSICDRPSDLKVETQIQDDSGVCSGAPCQDLALPGPDAFGSPPAIARNPQSPTPSSNMRCFALLLGSWAKKLARTDNGLELRADQIAVERCAVHQLDFQQRQVSAHVNQLACQSEAFQRSASMDSCLLWRALQTKAAFRGSVLSTEADAVLQALVKAGVAGNEGDKRALGRSFELSIHSANY